MVCKKNRHSKIWIACASSDDGQTHGLIGICPRCTAAEARLPRAIMWKRLNRSLVRALAEPEKYLVKVYLDSGAAQAALALLQHPEHGRDMLVGWDGGR